MKRKVKVTITGEYELDTDEAHYYEIYNKDRINKTDDWVIEEMLLRDKKGIVHNVHDILELMENTSLFINCKLEFV